MARYFTPRRRWIVVTMCLTALGAGWLTAGPATAAGKLDKLDTSLNLIPADAAFYSTMLRTREQFDAVADSRAWAKVKDMPLVKMGLLLYQLQSADPDGPAGQFKAAMADPKVKKVVEVLVEMVSDEIFFYGDEGWADLLELFQEVNAATTYGPLAAMLRGDVEDLDAEQIQAKMAMAAVVEHLDDLKVPNLVVGFKVKNTQQATELLDELKDMIDEALELEEAKDFEGRLERTKVAGHEYLTFTLDGSMIPWDELPLDELEEFELNEGDAAKIIERIKREKFVVALGLRENYVLLAIGSSTDCLARLGKGERLIDRPEFKPLEKFTDKQITSIGYVSESMYQRLNSNQAQLDGLVAAADELLPLSDLDEKEQAQIRKDVAAMAKDVEPLLPKPGAVMGFNFLTEHGIEGYQHNWGKNFGLDGSKPLGLLQHVGGTPMLAVVARGVHRPEDYDMLVKWGKVAYGYFEKHGLPQMSKRERRDFDKVMKRLTPLLERADKANREMLIPALADGQGAFVLDTKLTSKQFHEEMPESDRPLPMLEPAVVLGVSDAELLRKGCAEYRAVFDGLLDVIREVDDEAVPDNYKIPWPKAAKGKSGTIWTIPLPKEWGVDKKIAPCFGLSETVAVAAISRKHVERLLKATPLGCGGVLAKPKRPMAMAVVFDWAGFVEAARPWVDYGIEQANGLDESIVSQIDTVLDVLQVFRGVTAESYFEDDAMVTHTLLEIRDVEE